jgi:hypothetical protein
LEAPARGRSSNNDATHSLYAPQEFSCSVLAATLRASEGRFETLRGVVAHDYSTQQIDIAPVDASVIEFDITLNLLPGERVEVYDQRPYFVSEYGRAVQVDRERERERERERDRERHTQHIHAHTGRRPLFSLYIRHHRAPAMALSDRQPCKDEDLEQQ